MDIIHQFLPENILYALGWTVVHSLWQGLAAALLLGAYLLGWQKKDAAKRYLAANLTLVITLMLAVVTFVFYYKNGNADQSLTGALSAAGGTITGHDDAENTASFFSKYFNENMPLIVTIWMLGLAFFLLKMLSGLLYIQRLRQRNTVLLTGAWEEVFAVLCNKSGIYRHIRLAESALVRVPMVVGWLKPVILIPLGAINSLTPAQVEAILAHELAHIHRQDYLFNLLQSIVEMLFYFNPAVWWISANIRTERENCCDDMAVRLCGNSVAYARALVSLQEMHQSTPAFALSFSKNNQQLLHRIRRILQPAGQNKSNIMEKLSATLLLLAAVLMLSVQANTPFGNMLNDVIAKKSSGFLFGTPGDHESMWVQNDTLPSGNRETHLHRKTDSEDVEIKMKDDEIILLKVNGEEIPKERYSDYEEVVEGMLQNYHDAPIPPVPPVPGMYYAPPSPPDAPMPPDVPAKRTRKIITQKDGHGTTFIIENEDGGDPVEIQVRDGKKGLITINGQEISGLKKGDQTIIMQELENWPGNFNWNDGNFTFAVPPPGFNADNFHFEMPDMAEGFEFNWTDEQEGDWHRELEARTREGRLDEEWLNEYREHMNEQVENMPQLRQMEAIQDRLLEQHSRMQEELQRLSEDRQQLNEDRQERLREIQEDASDADQERARDLREQAREQQQEMRQQMEEHHREMEEQRREMDQIRKEKRKQKGNRL